MGYPSEYSGDRIEAVIRRVDSMILGTAEVPATIDGSGFKFVQGLTTSMAAPKIFCTVRPLATPIQGFISAVPDFDPETGTLLIWIRGEGIKAGTTYAVDYMLIE
ncbi:MAG: hypothetical protein IJN57_06990 [Oscillospiraceae bacterium]|nr:hypothetical protein [Oscillospiraceae bacterium]